MLDLKEDHHLHSTFSDGRNSTRECLDAAYARGLRHIAFCDHVRFGSEYLPRYVRELSALRRTSARKRGPTIEIAVEAKILDQQGTLDLPRDICGVERVAIADHQLPTPAGLYNPRQVRAALLDGSLRPHQVVEFHVQSQVAAIRRAPCPVRIAHPFSFLPKVGLSDHDVSGDQLDAIAQALVSAGGQAEASERWRGPSTRVLRRWADAGVELVASTDAHHAKDIGVYAHLADLTGAFAHAA